MQDIVILLDTSGSMTGLRKEIAKHVVINIMETLGEDDFVTVLTFSHETKPLVECFTDSDGEAELVQATNENIAEFTEAINNIETMEIANFTSALTAAFTLLERYRTKKVRPERLLTARPERLLTARPERLLTAVREEVFIMRLIHIRIS